LKDETLSTVSKKQKVKFMNKLLFIAFVYVILCACSPKTNVISLKKTDDIYIVDIDNSPTEKKLKFSSLFKKVTPIVLETSDDVLIGTVSSFQVHDGHIYVLDAYYAECLFVFDMEGRFIRRIGRTGSGPGEYTGVLDFSINPDRREIYLLDANYRLHRYNFDGRHINTVKIYSAGASVRYIQYHKQLLYTSMYQHVYTDGDYLLQSVNPENGMQYKRYLGTDEYNKGWNELYSVDQGFFVGQNTAEPKYIQLFMDTVVAIGDDGPYGFLAIKSRNLVTKKNIDALKEQHKTPSERYDALMMADKVFSINNYIESKDFIYFNYHRKLMMYKVLYNPSTRSARIFNTTENDLVYKKTIFHTRFGCFDSRGAYECINTLFLPEFIKQIRDGNLLPDLKNMDKLLELTEDSNPVIFFYEFKD
jgi:hypothetical protein